MGNDDKSRVLVIDDEESIRTLLRISLIHKGYDVTTAEDGEKGLRAFERQRHPIVITDIKMPGMDGLQVLSKIRRIDPDTRVIVITGHGDMQSAIESLKLEASDFINKPIKEEALTVALKRAEEILWMKHKTHYTKPTSEVLCISTQRFITVKSNYTSFMFYFTHPRVSLK